DRKGRKRALSQSLLFTAIAASAIALVPGYRLLGVAAPIVLLVGRLLQGIAFGGVFAGAVLYAGEWAPEGKRGFRTSWIQIAPILGLLLSVAVVSVIHRATPLNLFPAYGWRFAFLPTLILFWLSWYMRRMEETPVFRELRENATSRPRYLRNKKNLKPLLTIFCVASAQAAIWYLAQFYVRFHLQNVLKVNPVTATYVVAIALLLGLPFFILFGALSDKIGRRKIILSGCLLAAVLAVPLYAGTQRAAGTHVATISPARDPITGAAGPTPLMLSNGGLTPAGEGANPNVIALTALVLLQVIVLSMVSGPLGAYFAEAFSAGVRFRSTALSYNLAHGVVGTLLPFFSLPLLVTTGDIYAGLYYPIAIILVSFAVAVFTLRETVHGDRSKATPALKTRAAVAGMMMVLLLSPCLAIAADFKRDVIYQIVTDRFVDGDPSNNDPPQSRGLFDATRENWQAYWGGDLEGIRQKIPYLAGMGITAIWISPPSDNLNAIIRTAAGVVRAPYYAYQPRDLKRVEEHFGDVNNSWEPFDKLVAAAHEHG
ncbi:MAG TPA: MFS transporter, partial [Pyrinomonadaceae bacterium]